MSYADIPGWFSSELEYERIVERVESGATLVEVGVAFGRSIAFLARKVIESGKSVGIIGVDPFLEVMGQEQADKQWIGRKYATAREAFEGLMAEHAPLERRLVALVQRPSVEAAAGVPDGSVDFVFIDANHEYDSVREDIAAWRPKVKRGGVIAGDDYNLGAYPGVVRAVQEAFGATAYSVRGVTWWAEVR